MNSTIRRMTGVALFALLASCTVGPDYKKPKVAVMSEFGESEISTSTTRASIVTTRPVQITQWWATFEDPELDSLVRRAAMNNLSLRMATSRLLQARAQRGVTGSEMYPELNADGGYQRARGSKNVSFPASIFSSGGGGSANGGSAGNASQTNGQQNIQNIQARPAANGGGVSAAPSAPLGGPASPLGLGGLPGADTELYQAGFDASWELDVFGGLRRSIEASDDDTQAAIEDRRSVLISLLAEVARNYIELRGAQREAFIARENLASQQDTLDLTKAKYKAGFVTDYDVAQAAYVVYSTQATLPVFEASIHRSIHELGILLGQDPDSLSAELLPSKPVPNVPPEVPIGVPSDLLRRRPDIRRAERQLAAATARIGVAKADYFPRFSLTGSFGLDSTKIKQLPDWNSRYFVVSPGVSWPIFDAGRIRNNVNVQKEIAHQAALNYRETILNATRDVEDSLTLYRTEQVRNKSLEQAVDAARQAVDLAKQQYKNGVIDFLFVLDSERSLFSAEDTLVQSDRAISTDLVALYKSLGGGWEAEQSATPPAVPQEEDGHNELTVGP